jgi:hypothetical protein
VTDVIGGMVIWWVITVVVMVLMMVTVINSGDTVHDGLGKVTDVIGGMVCLCWNVICPDGRRRVLAISVVDDYVHAVVVGVW